MADRNSLRMNTIVLHDQVKSTRIGENLVVNHIVSHSARPRKRSTWCIALVRELFW